MGEIVNTLEDKSANQKDPAILESWAGASRMEFSADTCKVLHLGKTKTTNTK